MKKFAKILASCFLTAALVLTPVAFNGCTTTANGTKQVDFTLVASVVQATAESGTEYALVQLPQSRPYFTLVVASLNTFVLTSTNTTPADLANALKALPVQELSSPEVQIAVNTVVNLYNAYYAQTAKATIAQNVAVTQLITAIRDGVTLGMQGVPAPAGYKFSVQFKN